ncbi:unnamed protein product [Rhizoctonia solani]|uniref:G domain-containing protein n=1 Tax=Rhizoctonia solani TaxID=456999 RepID=A0A8H3DDH2_9AGAM|nr:unnamed protein product [Rhizoctonia solani]
MDNVLIAVFGAAGTGKTTFINDASRAGLPTHREPQPYTASVQQSPIFRIDRTNVVLFDMPSFDDAYLSEAEILKCISEYLAALYRNGSKLTGIIYMHRITDTGISGIARRTFKLFLQLCGKESLPNVLIVTNMWSHSLTQPQINREAELCTYPDFFQSAIEQGATMARRFQKSHRSAEMIIRVLASKAPIVMQIQQELVDQGKSLSDTAAWQELERNLTMAPERLKVEMGEHQAQLENRREAGDDSDRDDLLRYQQDVKAAEERFVGELAALRKGYEDARWNRQAERIRDEIKEIEACQRAVREGLEAALRQQEASENQLRDFQRRLADLGI